MNLNKFEDEFKAKTVGLVSAEDYRRHREELNQQVKVKLAEESAKQQQAGAAGKSAAAVRARPKLSFVASSSDGEEEDDEAEPVARKKVKPNPTVDSSFLPDSDRQLEEQRLREQLSAQWDAEQAEIKAQMIEVTYSFYDGAGHRRTLRLSKGTTIAQFLDKVRQEFHALRSIAVDQLLFIKEDVIVPHNLSFYDLIVTKARGKSGPLYLWDAVEEVRLRADATREKEDSHAAKVVEHRYYERNKHIFPMCRWEFFDPNVKREKYTIS